MKPGLRLAAVRLRVPDLKRSVEFYTRRLGLVLTAESPGEAEAHLATTATGAPILSLLEDRSAPPTPREAAGLFHAALLFHSRSALGSWLSFAAAQGLDFEGFSDHGVSEAIYFSDPDGNGLEFYADRPESTWPRAPNGEIAMTTRPLDLRSLLAGAADVTTTPLAGAHWGHLHLRVTDLERSEEFYRRELGVEVTQRSYPGARFLAADGYHHHLGLNTWGNPRLPSPPHALGLAEAMFARASAAEETALCDPDGIAIRIQPRLGSRLGV